MKAILLAAGEGKRMRPLTLETPKPMIDVLGKPLLHHLIDGLPAEITELIMVIGYKGDQIKKYFGAKFEGRPVTYVVQKKQIGNADALELCKPFLKKGERFLFMFTDDLHSPKAIKALLKHDIGTLVQEHSDPSRFGVFEVDKNNRVISMEEKPKKPKSNLVAVGVYVLDTRIFDYKVRQSVNGEYFMTDQIDQLIKEHKFVIEKTDFWHPIGYPHDIDAAEKILSKSKKINDAWGTTQVVILAGGKGTRLPSGEQGKPKCLVEIAGKPILQHQLELLGKQGFKNILIALGYRAEMVVDWLKVSGYKHLKTVVEKEPLGTGGGLKFASKGLKEPFLVLFGDILADFNFRAVIRASARGKYRVLAGVQVADVTGLGVLECDEMMRICAFKEKQASGVPGIINANASMLNPADFKDMPEKFSIEHDLYPKLAAAGKLVIHHHKGNYWFNCGTDETLKMTREYFSQSH